jgi:hypothetical protein
MVGNEALPGGGLSASANGGKKLLCAKLFGPERLLARKLLAPKSSGLSSSEPAIKRWRQLSSAPEIFRQQAARGHPLQCHHTTKKIASFTREPPSKGV